MRIHPTRHDEPAGRTDASSRVNRRSVVRVDDGGDASVGDHDGGGTCPLVGDDHSTLDDDIGSLCVH
jgi:hypothetical protein